MAGNIQQKACVVFFFEYVNECMRKGVYFAHGRLVASCDPDWIDCIYMYIG